jgi:hypothetical protein
MAAIGQVTAPTSGNPGAFVCSCPPNSTVVLSTVENSADVFLGTSTAVTSANGFPLDNAGPTMFVTPSMASTFSLYAVAGTGTHIVGYLVIPGRP